jgi:hypothetical protein
MRNPDALVALLVIVVVRVVVRVRVVDLIVGALQCEPNCTMLLYISKYGNESLATRQARLESANPDEFVPPTLSTSTGAIELNTSDTQDAGPEIDFDIDIDGEGTDTSNLVHIDYEQPDASIEQSGVAEISWDIDADDAGQWQITTEEAGDAAAGTPALDIDWDIGSISDADPSSALLTAVPSSANTLQTHSILHDAKQRGHFYRDLYEVCMQRSLVLLALLYHTSNLSVMRQQTAASIL